MHFRSVGVMLVGAAFALTATADPSVYAAEPLTPVLECSACEVTAREIYAGYTAISGNARFAGSELELVEVLEGACTRLGKYQVFQEAFGAHMKVFADPANKFDVQNVEGPTYYSRRDRARYENAVARLVTRCQEWTGRMEDDIVDLVSSKASEQDLRRFMCLDRTKVCQDATLAEFKRKDSRRRKKWKRKTNYAGRKLEEEFARKEKKRKAAQKKNDDKPTEL